MAADDRDPATGRFTPLNRAAEQHGVATAQRRGSEALNETDQRELEDFVARLVADLGGFENMSAAQFGLVSRLEECCLVALACRRDLAAHGLFTSRGRQRTSVNTLGQFVDRFSRIIAQLGLAPMPLPDLGATKRRS